MYNDITINKLKKDYKYLLNNPTESQIIEAVKNDWRTIAFIHDKNITENIAKVVNTNSLAFEFLPKKYKKHLIFV